LELFEKSSKTQNAKPKMFNTVQLELSSKNYKILFYNLITTKNKKTSTPFKGKYYE